MDLKSLQKKICVHSKAGEFSQALQLISGTKLVKETALNILIAASNACYHNPEKCHLDVMEKFLNVVVSSIDDALEETHLTVYFQSIFHIIKLICKEERFEDLTKMEYAINPSFLKNSLKRNAHQAIHTCLMVVKQISQSVSQLAQKKNLKYNKYLLDIFKILLRVQNKVGIPKDLLILAQTCFNQLHYLEATSDQLLIFYSILLEVLSTHFEETNECSDTILLLLVPIFSNILTDIVRGRNFEFATMFVEIIESRVRSNFKQTEFEQSHVLFKAITALLATDKDVMEVNMDKAKLLLHTFKTSNKKLFYNIIGLVEEPLLQLLSCYRNSGLYLWCQLPDTIIVKILKFLMDEVTCYSHLLSKKCACGCSTTKNYCGTLKIGCQMAALLKSYLDRPKDQMENLSKEFFSQLEKWLVFFYSIIKKLKQGGCQKWTSYYSELACHTYNMSVVLYKSQNTAHKVFDVCFLKNSLELEGTQPEIRPVNTNTFAFSALCEIEAKKENWSVCMGLAALHCLLYPQNSNTVFQNWWIRPKMKEKEDLDFQQQTLPSVLYKQSKQLSYIFDVESWLTTERKIQLLIFELTRYRAVWRSKVSMMAAFEHLTEIADVSTIAEVILQIYGDGEIPIHNDMSSVFLSVMKSIEGFLAKKKGNSKITLALAVLYFYHFKASFKETADKNLQEMEKTMQVLESVKSDVNIEPVPKDANDECDIVSAYSNLRLNKFMEVLESLNTCQEHIGTLMGSTFESDICKSTSRLLTKIGFEYRLQCFSIKSLQAFEMSMKFAQKVSDSDGHLFALSFLIESTDVRKKFVQELLSQGDKLAKQLESENENERYSKTLATYYVSKSKAFLHEDAKQSYQAWQAADVICRANDAKDEFQILRSELYIVLYKLTRNCDFIMKEHERQPMTLKLHLAYDIVIEMVKKNVLSSYELCVLFDTVYEVTKTYHLMRLPRDLRAYSKHSVLLAQKIVLPVRCVSFLMLLAHSDLATCKFDHCSVKLNGINDIFCLSESRSLCILNERADVEIDTKKAENEVDRCTSLIKELVLDVPQHTRQYSPSSPTLTVESFKFPQFLSHENTCTCFMCLSFEIQRLLLEKYHLNGLLNMYEKEDKTAEDFIGGALSLYRTLYRNYNSYIAKASKIVSDSFILDFTDNFLESYASILHDYSYHMARKSLITEALKINSKLIHILKPKKVRYVHLYHDALLQRLSYIVPNPNETSFETGLETEMKTIRLTPSDSAALLARTPASKKSTVTVMINGVSNYSPPRRRGKKCNLFGGQNSSGDTLKKSSVETSKGLTPKSDKFKMVEDAGAFAVPKLKGKKAAVGTPSTPVFGNVETPKIQIFTDEEPNKSLKTYSRKRISSMRKQTAINTTEPDNAETKNIVSNVSSLSLDKLSEVQQQPPIISGKSRTKSRGQLLLQKIKESSAQKANNGSTTRLRRNLADELLKDKLPIPASKSETTDSSLLSESPEHVVATTKTKAVLGKLKASAKKAEKRKKIATEGSNFAKNLLSEFENSDTSVNNNSSCSTKCTGAIRKSTRNRVL